MVPLQNIVAVLRQFKTELKQPSADLLRVRRIQATALLSLDQETKIGLAVGKLRTHSSKDVADLAKELVKQARTMISAALRTQWKSAVGSTSKTSTSAAQSKSQWSALA